MYEYKFIAKIKEIGKLLNWFIIIFDLLRVIETNNYNFIKNKVWVEINDWNSAINEGIDLGEVRF